MSAECLTARKREEQWPQKECGGAVKGTLLCDCVAHLTSCKNVSRLENR